MTLADFDQQWAIILLRGKRPVGAFVRIVNGGLTRVEIDVPATEHHQGYLAILSPQSILGGTICTEEQARLFNLAAPDPLMHNPTIFASESSDITDLQK